MSNRESAPAKAAVTAAPQSRMQALDGLRGFATILVLLGHAAISMGWPVLAGAVLFQGYRALVIFFALSGFLITSLMVRELNRTGRIALGAFYYRRAMRLIPAFAVFLIIIAILAANVSYISVSLRQWLSAAFFINNYVSGEANAWWVGHSWSLAIEVQFLLIWPLILYFFGPKIGLRVAAVAIVLGPIVRVGQYLLFESLRGNITITFHTRVDSFLIGGAFALLLNDERFREHMVRWCLRLAIPATAFIVLVEPYLAGFFALHYYFPIGYTMDGVASGIIIVACLNGSKYVIKFFSFKAFTFVGINSYSTYLFQQLFINHFGPPPWNNGLLGIALSVLAGYLGYQLVEKPFLKFSTRKNAAKQSPPPLPGPAVPGDKTADVADSAVSGPAMTKQD
jgi:peptidoglycan/LPS O-acetylase OafA/YrhL